MRSGCQNWPQCAWELLRHGDRGATDPDPGRARALALRHPGARVGRALADFAEHDQVEAVHVCTPLSTHATLVRQALDAGLHVLAEKPLAETASITAEL